MRQRKILRREIERDGGLGDIEIVITERSSGSQMYEEARRYKILRRDERKGEGGGGVGDIKIIIP